MPCPIAELIQEQQNSYKTVFEKDPFNCHQPIYHYDWWMFPQKLSPNAKVSDTTKKFAINDPETLELLSHPLFISTYVKSIDRYLSNLEQQGWNNYDIRYAKMLYSLGQFLAMAKTISGDAAIGVLIPTLQGLATRAINFAQNIATPSNLLQSGKIKLQTVFANTSPILPMPTTTPVVTAPVPAATPATPATTAPKPSKNKGTMMIDLIISVAGLLMLSQGAITAGIFVGGVFILTSAAFVIKKITSLNKPSQSHLSKPSSAAMQAPISLQSTFTPLKTTRLKGVKMKEITEKSDPRSRFALK